MLTGLRILLLMSLGAVAGCAGQGGNAFVNRRPVTTASTRPLDAKALLPLKQLQPPATLPAPATQSAERPPLEAVKLYAKARIAILSNDRVAATALLEQASKLDPDSFEIWFALGKAYAGTGNGNPEAISAMLRAEAIDADSLDVQVQLGRMYLNVADWDKAILHLRRARLTSDYPENPNQGAVADLLLGRALQQQGYDQAAIECYDSLLTRLQEVRVNAYAVPELYNVIRRLADLYVQVAEIYERHGRLEDSLHYLRLAESRGDGDLQILSRIFRILVAMGRENEAKQRAADIVVKLHASPESLEVFRDLYRQLGRESAVADELTRLLRNSNGSKPILFALVEFLRADKHDDQAAKLLEEFWASTNADPEIVRRLFDLYSDHKQSDQAAKLLVESLGRRPGLLRDTEPMWDRLLRSGALRLHLSTLQDMKVSPQAQAAKMYWVARLAEIWNRESLVRSSLEQSAAARPAFAPAYRMLMGRYWSRPEWDEARKTAASQKLIDRVQQGGDAALASELTGLLRLNQNQIDQAIDCFTQAIKLGDDSPDLQLVLARALAERKAFSKAEQMLWKLVSDYPAYDGGYQTLFNYYAQRRAPEQAIKVLQTWLASDPTSTNARLLQAGVLSTDPQTAPAAEKLLNELFQEQPQTPAVLSTMAAFYSRDGRKAALLAKLEGERRRHPDNRVVVEGLVDLYSADKRPGDATRALDDMRSAVAADPDLLYYVAHLYERVDQKQTTEQVLLEVLKLDPRHAGAGNDLGYMWAEEGKNLDKAESLIRIALQEEPDNGAFLDSLGWVLYKRGRFAEARGCLEQAIKGLVRPDPVVLDHLGDVLYRLAQKDQAADRWQKSLERMGDQPQDDGPEIKLLRLQLREKIRQQKAGEPVKVAPVENESRPTQASK